jgi:hypothetical protein
MKSILRTLITRLMLYAFGPEKGRAGIRLMSFSNGSFIFSLADEEGKNVASVKLVDGHLELVADKDLTILVRGSVLSEITGSHWENVGNVKALNATILTQQDGQLGLQVRDIKGMDAMLDARAVEMMANATKLQDNMESEQCHPHHDHAPSVPSK